MLCSRSASFTATTRASADLIVVIAWTGLRPGRLPRRSSAVTSATIAAVPAPNSRLSAAIV